jgi:hypothetical protein
MNGGRLALVPETPVEFTVVATEIPVALAFVLFDLLEPPPT